ncbi:MAG: Hsp20/alpha crystallin family protein [Bacteroidetes bacterium]|nr:MAG: Hsp20/alpha crystallin family protein [Bacteroidota bacterium]
MKPAKVLPNTNTLFPSLNTLWEDFFGRDLFELDRPAYRLPAVNVQETPEAFVLEFALPGLRKEDVKIELDQNMLILSSEREESQSSPEGEGTYTRREFRHYSFRRAFTLPESVDSSDIRARSEDGILYVTLPKKEEARPKQIPVSVQ